MVQRPVHPVRDLRFQDGLRSPQLAQFEDTALHEAVAHVVHCAAWRFLFSFPIGFLIASQMDNLQVILHMFTDVLTEIDSSLTVATFAALAISFAEVTATSAVPHAWRRDTNGSRRS